MKFSSFFFKKNIFFIIIWLLCLVWLSKFLIYFIQDVPLGYDAGLYRAIFFAYQDIMHQGSFDFSSLPWRIKHEPLWAIVTVFLVDWGMSLDRRLTRWVVFFHIILWWVLWFFLLFVIDNKTMTHYQSAVLIVLVFMCYHISVIQYEFFYLLYMKQLIASILMFLFFMCFFNKQYIVLTVIWVTILFLHRHTALVSFFSVGLFSVYQMIRDRFFDIKIVFSLLIGVWWWLLLYWHQFANLIWMNIVVLFSTIGGQWLQGTFFSVGEYMIWNSIFLIVACYGLYHYRPLNTEKKQFVILCLCFCLVWILLWLLNMRRMIIFLDFFVIILVAYGMFYFLFLSWSQSFKKRLSIFLIVVFSQVGLYLYYLSLRHVPLVSSDYVATVKMLDYYLPDNAIVLITDSMHTPWIAWYSQRDWISPWLSDLNIWSYDQRLYRWNSDGSTKCRLIQDFFLFHRPIYLFVTDDQYPENIQSQGCVDLLFERKWIFLYRVLK